MQGGAERQFFMTEKEIQQTPWSIPILWAVWIAWLLGFALSHGVQMDTHYPERFTFVWWTELLVFCTRLALIFALGIRLTKYTDPWAINFGFMFTIIAVLMECCTIAAKALLRPALNKSPLDPSHAGSALYVGNDPIYCCVYGNETLSRCNFYLEAPICNKPGLNITEIILEDGLIVATEFDIAFYLSIIMCLLAGLMFVLSTLAKRTLYAVRTYTDSEGNTTRVEKVELDPIGSKNSFVTQHFD